MKNKVLPVIILFFIIISINNFAFANDKLHILEDSTVYTSGNYKYTIKKEANIDIAVITEYTGTEEIVTIPTTLGGKTVKEISEGIFTECTNLKKVIVNANIGTIPQHMFKNCKNLEEVQINGKTKKIEQEAFFACVKLSKVILPDTLEEILTKAFWCCRGLKSITIPKNVVLIEKCAFYEFTNYSTEYWADTDFDISQTELKKQANGNYAAICDYNVQGTRDYKQAYEVLEIVNKERKNAGLDELTMDKDLLENAMHRAAELYIYYSHERPNGSSCFTAITKTNYEYTGENIAINIISSDRVMNAWMNSAGHRKNILTDFTCIGVGCFKGPNGQYHWVQIFSDGTPTTLSKPANKDVTERVETLKNRIPLESISLNEDIVILELEQTYTLKVSYNPENTAVDKTVHWYSSDESIIEVDLNGKIITKREGEAIIYAKVGNKIASCHVIVTPPTYPLKSISLNKTSSNLKVGETDTLAVTYNPTNTTDSKLITWTSSNTGVATINASGVITALKAGTTTITAKVGSKTANCTVTVTVPTYPLKSIKLNKTDLKIEEGVQEKLQVTYDPTNTTDNKTVTWTSSNTKIATVDKSGIVKGIKEGTAEITAKVGTKTAKCKVTVEFKLPFTDVPKDTWYTEAVKYTYKNKYIYGYTNTTFAPFDKLSRGQLVTILWRIEGEPDTSKLKNKFTDVGKGLYYTEPIKWATSVGIVSGYGGTTNFGPGDPIIRQDLCIILYKYAKYKGKDMKITSNLTGFADYKNISTYAVDAVKWCIQNGIITGNALADGTKTIAPANNATRCEVAIMLMRYCNKFN